MQLDQVELFEKFDPEDIGYGIENLPEQIRLAWHDTRDIEIPRGYGEVANIVAVGMGGSALGFHMLQGVVSERLSIPFEIIRDYTLPGYVSRNTLVILSSYSGTTEEVLAAAESAKKARAKVLVLATGGKLAEMAEAECWPAYIFEPGDLAKQPRYSTGFAIIGVLGLLERVQLVKVKDVEIENMISAMAEVIDNCAVDVPSEENPAKQVAYELQGKNVMVIGAEHLSGNAHVMSNQINETAKQFSQYAVLPEINHHLLEGLRFPGEMPDMTTAVLLQSTHYHPRIAKRCDITADIFEKKGVSVIEYVTKGETKFEEIGEVLQFGSYVGWYLAILNEVITTDIKTIEDFKARMAE